MNILDKNACAEAAGALIDEINGLEPMPFSELEADRTALVVVDVINGFIKEGEMASPRIESVVLPTAKLLGEALTAGMPAIAFADCHGRDSVEFLSFPPHCIENTSESEVVDELKNIGGYKLIRKNSTNGFHEGGFRDFINENPQIDAFVVTGDCTDICVLQFCLSLKTWFTARNKRVRIIVPLKCVETYDAPFHNADFANVAAYKLMKDSGIEFVSEVICGA